MQQNDITRPDERQHLVGVSPQRPLVVLALLVTERAAVAGRAVKAVVDPLGDGEELGIALDHQPARIDPGAACV